MEGVVYKPANFDPNKKYPMIVNFYERNSETLYEYHMPEPHRSTIDYRLYNSNGYIVFNPDIRYRDGYPGESCYNCLMPGVSMMIAKGYIDEKAIGAQGHSWGGYQVAYLATRTNLFAAINMSTRKAVWVARRGARPTAITPIRPSSRWTRYKPRS